MLKFADLTKSATDYFKKTFSFGKTAKVTTSTDANVDLEGEWAVCDGGNTSASLNAKFSSGSFKAKKVKLSQSGRVQADFQYTDLADGTTLTFALDEECCGSHSAKLGVEVVQDSLAVTADVDLAADFAASASAVFGFEGAVLGGSISLADFKPAGYSAALGYRTDGTSFVLQADNELKDLTIAGSVAYNGNNYYALIGAKNPLFCDSEEEGDCEECCPMTVQLGAAITCAAGTRYLAVDQSGKARIAQDFGLGDGTTLRLSGQADIANFAEGDNKVGLKLTIAK